LQNRQVDEYRQIFNEILTTRIKEARNSSLLEYDRFKTRGYDNIDRRPLRYFFARVEKYICDNIKKEIENNVHYIYTKTGHKTGYHIEHIFSRNEENKKFFQSEKKFENQKNRLGALLLLYNMDNIISNNEKYYDGKRQTYSNGLVWGRTLIDKTNSKFLDFSQEFKSIEEYNADILEYRSKLLYEIVKQIWDINL
jgi:hypothetical protein